MTYVAGIDVGSRTTKCVILDADEQIVARSWTTTGAFLAKAAEQAFLQALHHAGLEREDVVYVASTGWGRYQVPFRDIQITDITCHARGAVYLHPEVRTIIDIGAQNTRAIRVEPSGRVRTFRMNNRCAAGAGRFLERTAAALEVPLEEMGPLSLRSEHPEPISSICAVMAESEVINLVSHEARLEDILAGVHRSLVERIVSLVRQVGVEPVVMLTGGVARNIGMVQMLQQYLETEVMVHEDAVYAGAIGAALLGWTRVRKRWFTFPDHVRTLRVEDAPRVAAIDAALTGTAPRPDYWQAKIRAYIDAGEPAIGLDQDGQLVGYMMGYVRGREFGFPERVGWIEFIGVDPEYHGRGIGRTLLHAMLRYFRNARVREVYTLVRSDRPDLQRFFRSMQFVQAPVVPLFRTTDEHAANPDDPHTGAIPVASGDRRGDS